MITSKQLLELTGISRATLNNYISLGFIPKPQVMSPLENNNSSTKRIGFFQDEVIERINEIKHLKKNGLGISELINYFKTKGLLVYKNEEKIHIDTVNNVTMSLDSINCPSLMINYNFEVVWLNDSVKKLIWNNKLKLDDNTKLRNIFDVISQANFFLKEDTYLSLIELFVFLAKTKYNKSQIESTIVSKTSTILNIISNAYDKDSDFDSVRGVLLKEIFIETNESTSNIYNIAITTFREGILLVFVPIAEYSDSIINYLSRRDLVIKELLKNKIPTLTSFAVLVTDLQSSTRICAELPANEYFELINEIWTSLDPIFRQFYGTHGKHVGDGLVYYFFPKPDSSYTFNAVQCAMMIKNEMRKINERWKIKKGWLRDLYLNTSIHEGQEWLGTFQTSTSIEFTVLGDTINQASRICDFARFGAIWASKKLMSQLTFDELSKVHYGVYRLNNQNQQTFISNTYAQVDTLIDLNTPKHDKLKEIATLSITEIQSISL
ncbi:adenylate/guanylate cyclase domain-containing protein [Ferrovum sp. PN-J185]|uniref:adenylate/guanylate cyclase domain-containing protein n=1 Tax=Ferrovum sp. PN-J185 TaxID=1356306 RepID=UPI00079234BC|nr:adenylate/guanylate cyclase domain-containing protein [Ferrovum sp. PN-J185]KXW56974.1 adenylate cyclase 1 [Ferrovum sp. PN-J185]